MTTKEWRKEHRRLGLCRYCKLPALNGKGRCSKHYLENLEYGRIFYSLNSERMKIQNDEYRNDHQKKGLCRGCTNPIKPGHFFCAVCLEKRRVKSFNSRNRYREEGRCTSCSMQLNPEMDAGHVRCLFCREEIPKGESWKSCPEYYRGTTT